MRPGGPIATYDRRADATMLRVGLLAVLLFATVATARAGDGGGGAAPRDAGASSVRIVGDGTAIVADGGARLAIDAWQAWAASHLGDQVRTPLGIGPTRFGPADFDRFGAAAVAPDGERIVFTVTTYAMLTTLSLVGVLEADGSVAMLPEGRTGDLHEVTWSPSGTLVAYAVATARATGEALHVDDVAARRSLLSLDRGDLLAALAAHEGRARPSEDERNAYLPHVRDLVWDEHERLTFTVDVPSRPGAPGGDPDRPREPGVRLSVSPRQGELRVLGPHPP